MIALSDAPFEMRDLVAAVMEPGCGALVTFVGYVRACGENGAAVESLHYEAHRALALHELEAVAHDARERFAIAAIAIVHRVGVVPLGEAAVGVAVSAAHRAAAFQACEFAIDDLKRRVPIWKQERYAGGDARWIENA